jgi:hypothetical protein
MIVTMDSPYARELPLGSTTTIDRWLRRWRSREQARVRGENEFRMRLQNSAVSTRHVTGARRWWGLRVLPPQQPGLRHGAAQTILGDPVSTQYQPPDQPDTDRGRRIPRYCGRDREAIVKAMQWER